MAKDAKKDERPAVVRVTAKGKDEPADRSIRHAQAERAYEILGDPTERVSLAAKTVGTRNAMWDD